MALHNLLKDPLIRFETREGLERGSLPEVLAALMADRVACFPALRAHQEPAWHMFLAQLGAVAAHRADLSAPPEDAAIWQDIIGRLTRADFPNDEPWCLVVDDWTKPAFLQPPVPDGVNWTAEARTADALDLLSLSKNHDLKHSVAQRAELDNWLFSLVTQQTFDGALTNNPKSLQLGIARMNTGDGSRPLFGLAPVSSSRQSASLGLHLRHDLSVLIGAQSNWPALWTELFSSPSSKKIALTWIQPWTSDAPIDFLGLDPLFVEVSRVIRFDEAGGEFRGRRAGSVGRRVDSTATSGVTGDPWTPIDKSKSKPVVLTLGRATAHYEKLSRILFSEMHYAHPVCMDPFLIDASERDQYEIVVKGIARKKGHQTDTFVTRSVPLGHLHPRKVLGSRRLEVGELAERQISEIKKVHDLLVSAIGVFGRGGVEWCDVPAHQRNTESAKQRERTQPYRDRLDAVADRVFFPALWMRFEAEQQGTPVEVETARRDLLRSLIDTARMLLDEGLADIPCRSILRPRAEARARRRFEILLRGEKTGFPALFAEETDEVLPDEERETTDAQ